MTGQEGVDLTQVREKNACPQEIVFSGTKGVNQLWKRKGLPCWDVCSPRPEGSLSSHAGSLSLQACIASFWFIPSFGRIPSSGSFQERVHGGNLEVCSLYVGN